MKTCYLRLHGCNLQKVKLYKISRKKGILVFLVLQLQAAQHLRTLLSMEGQSGQKEHFLILINDFLILINDFLIITNGNDLVILINDLIIVRNDLLIVRNRL